MKKCKSGHTHEGNLSSTLSMLPSCRVSLEYGSLKSDSNSGLLFFFFGYGPSFSFSVELRKERLRYEFVEAWWCRD